MATNWHARSVEDVLTSLQSSFDQGLHPDAVQGLLTTHGPNALPEKQVDRWFQVLLRQFVSPLILILIAAAVVSFLLHEYVDTAVILGAVLVNTVIGFVQEYKANQALQELRGLVQPHALVVRAGVEQDVMATQLVPGDILVLQQGDRVTADARVIDAGGLMTNEASLTGESLPIEKTTDVLGEDVPLPERANMVFAGTSVVGGRAYAVVVATGVQTELGAIAQLVQEAEETQTPLQQQLARLAKWLAVAVIVLVGLLFLVGVIRGESLGYMFELSVALAVAAIPEGLIVSVTVILAIGMQRILRRQSLVRRLVAAETLGSVSVICSDKTGTITQGQMQVTHLATMDHTYTTPFDADDLEAVGEMMNVMVLCNDARYLPQDTQDPYRGSPTERALLQVAVESGIDVDALVEASDRTADLPFDSAYKYMATAYGTTVYLKGAPSKVLAFCTTVRVGGTQKPLSSDQLSVIDQMTESLTSQGIRLIALARKQEETEVRSLAHGALNGFVFMGLVGLRDPLRAEAKEQIAHALNAGIRTVIITGDHPKTAHAIAQEAGLVVGPEAVVTGVELDTWSDEELQKRVTRVAVYARVEPRHKIRIVEAWQKRGEVVSMTGDGVNDAPALKAADIGVAVGSGTEVAKQASDMVILNNDLGTITAAIEQGRVIFQNVRKVTSYLLAGSFTEVTLVGVSLVLGLPLPLAPIHILWINLVADSFPAVGLTLEEAESGVMNEPPRDRDEPVLNKPTRQLIVLVALVTNVFLIGLYLYLLRMGHDVAFVQTVMFAAVGLDTLIFTFSFRQFHARLTLKSFVSNRWLLLGVCLGLLVILAALFIPSLADLFELQSIPLSLWGVLIMMGAVKLVVIEGIKQRLFMHFS